METLLQALSRPGDASAKAPPFGGGAAESARSDSVPAFAEELRASVGLADMSASQAAPSADKDAPSGDGADLSVLLPTVGQVGSEGEIQPGKAPLLPNVAAAAIAGQGQAAAGEVPGTPVSLPATQTAAGALAATPATPATADGSGGLVQPAAPAVPASDTPAAPPNGQGGSPAAGSGADAAASAAQQGLQDSTLGQAISQIAATTKGSGELPNLLHAAMETVGQPQFLAPGATSARSDRPDGRTTAASAMTGRGGAVAGPADAASALRPATPGLSPMASETAALQANSAASRADLLPTQGDATINPNGVLAPSPSALAAGDAGPDMTLRPAVAQHPALDQVAIAIQKGQSGGQEQISLRLHPAELGRVEVHLELSDDGVLRASILAEKADTLHLLQRDSAALERALHSAGVKTDSGSLAFDLKNGGRDGEWAQEGARQTAGEAPLGERGEVSPVIADPQPSRHLGLLDLSV